MPIKITKIDQKNVPGISEKKPSFELVDLGSQTLESLESIHDSLLAAEQREPFPEDPIRIRLRPESIEYHVLLESGVPKDKIDRMLLTRSDITNAGYKFINILGEGEKGIISGEIIDPETGEVIDFTERSLLTEDELSIVYGYQQSNPGKYGLDGEDLAEVRKDMLSFLLEEAGKPTFGSNEESNVEFFDHLPNGAGSYIDDERTVGTAEDWKIVEAYWERKKAAYKKAHPEIDEDRVIEVFTKEQFAMEHCSDILAWLYPDTYGNGQTAQKARGVRASSFLTGVRQTKINGQPSPFLDSGLYFNINPDINVFTGETVDHRTNDQLRMSLVTIHLAGAHPGYPGFSEMGGESDQQYMPTGYYVNNIFPRDASTREQIHLGENGLAKGSRKNEIIREARRRLIETARAEMGDMQIRRFLAKIGIGRLR